MPSTFTQNTGIELIADGEQTALWGQTTNNNFDIVDRAVNGVGFITLSSTSLTLTTSSGVLSDGQFSTLVFSGTPGGTATVTIAPNTAQKTYSVRNQTDQTVVFTQGSGGNVSLPAGRSAVIGCTGAGASSAVFDVTALMNTATSANTAGAIVQRDGSGSFAGNASTATAWQTARNLTINGVAKSVDGTANVAFTGAETGAVPAGGIIMWSGAVAAVPTGWFLCDGTNGTPDLRGRFIAGAGGTYAPGTTGGADNVTLSTANLPSHTHSFSATTGGQSNDHSHFLNLNTNTAGAHNHTYSVWFQASNSGGSRAAVRSEILSGLDQYPTAFAGDHAHNVQGNTAGTSSNHTHTVSGTTGATGSGTAVENRPSFYSLAYIMKA
jgi:microcystin-dependent protein